MKDTSLVKSKAGYNPGTARNGAKQDAIAKGGLKGASCLYSIPGALC